MLRRTSALLLFSLLCGACRGPEFTGHERERALLLDYLRTEFRPDAPGGAVLVARGDEVLVHAAFGLADLERGRPMRTGDTLPIGSVTKSFAAAAILRLTGEGRLRLDDDIRTHLPEAPTDGRRVTLEQLLTHTSGMPNFVDRPDFEEWAQSPRSTAELVARTSDMDWLSEPGAEFHYSDSGYILLGAAVERVTGMAFDEYVVTHLARPLGMDGTWSAHRPRGAAHPGGPRGYSGGEFADPIDMSVAHAAGQLASTVHDLHLWVRAWERGEVVSLPLAERAWSGYRLADGSVSSYGFGWKCDELAGSVLVGHGGWVPGFTAGVAHLPDEGLTAIALVNTDDSDPEASYIARRALRLLLTGSPFVATIAVSAQRKARLTGHYRTARGTDLWIEDPGPGAHLTARWGEDAPLDLVALDGATFCVAESDGTWRFVFEGSAQGAAARVRTSLSGEPRAVATRVP